MNSDSSILPEVMSDNIQVENLTTELFRKLQDGIFLGAK